MVASLDALVSRAREQAGLSDLGPDGWQRGLERLLEAIEGEAVEPGSVERIEAILVERLVQRLRIEGWYADHGAEASAPVEGPVVIVGLPRTGTTALHHLLAVDPRFRYLRSWEVQDPVPPPVAGREHEDPRRPAEAPAADVRHIVTVDGPAEDWPLHALAFDHAELTLPVPSYSAWWRGIEHPTVCGYVDRVLRLLHSHRPPHHWLLKMPAYLFLLTEAAAQWPDVRFVWTHRGPRTVVASTCSTVAASRAERVPAWSPGPSFGTEMLEHWADGVAQALAARDELGEERFVDVAQADLERDPVGEAERIHSALGLEPDGSVAAAMEAWAERNRRGSRGEHRYSLEEYGLSPEQVEGAFAPYVTRFNSLLS